MGRFPSPPRRGFVPPRRLNYDRPAEHILNHFSAQDTPLRDHPGFKDANYTVPPPAQQGFTRSPKEDMALVCPECGVELGKIKEDVKKKEVWIGKCGHVYCGECSERQRINRGKGVKAGRCIVDGCNKIISGDKAMIRIRL